MHNTSTAVSPFYDQEPGAPPPFLPMLMDQLELFGSPHRSTMLVTDEILPPKPKNTLAPDFKLVARPSKNTDRLSRCTQRESLLNSDSSTSAASLSEDSKIPKPPGEPSHPGRGGYTICEALDWSPKAYSKFKAVNAFPNLENYSKFWPVDDMIMMRLKYTLGRARQKEAGMAMGKSKKHTPKKT
ncbi:hypothetical protein DFJ58DRAFT_735128 [Suillus subalutaceus]|uniref:uncharacterized protein n=1 Tax=Suillus subalutaceus TaxID=48586 RepID=UPI001B8780BA|nr:uncharacterized protein DFJ58DRAFT_735128 [Suillus subalutaceus]KAG1836202.1 hypothetical protein DFJ58DRAFT_735128 [Suillus subalutaceus]